MFGTNDYGKQLQKYRNKYGKTMPKERLEQLDREIQDQITYDFDETDKFMETQTTTNNSSGDGNGGFNQASHNAGKASAAAQEQSNRDYARGKFGQGGIASL